MVPLGSNQGPTDYELEKLYVSGDKEEIFDIDKNELERFIKKFEWKTDKDNLGFWKYRGRYSSANPIISEEMLVDFMERSDHSNEK